MHADVVALVRHQLHPLAAAHEDGVVAALQLVAVAAVMDPPLCPRIAARASIIRSQHLVFGTVIMESPANPRKKEKRNDPIREKIRSKDSEHSLNATTAPTQFMAAGARLRNVYVCVCV